MKQQEMQRLLNEPPAPGPQHHAPAEPRTAGPPLCGPRTGRSYSKPPPEPPSAPAEPARTGGYRKPEPYAGTQAQVQQVEQSI